MIPFQCYLAPDGNITVVDGSVIQLKNGVILAVGSGSSFAPDRIFHQRPEWIPFPLAWTGTFIGGSGRNLVVSGLSRPLSGPPAPAGIYKPGRPNIYRFGNFTLTVTGLSAATISDGTNTVAILSSGGTAPVGNYASTSYGATTYHGGSAFTLTAMRETAYPEVPVFPVFSSGMFFPLPAGNFTSTDSISYSLDADSTWTVTVNTDGSADLKKSGTIIASRSPGGSDCDPAGIYAATTTGMALNLTAAQPVTGEAYSVLIANPMVVPVAGFVWLKITEISGVLTAVDGPFFGTSLPANSGGIYYVPIAESDGIAFQQIHTGLLIWPESGGGGESVGKTWIRISRTAFAALTTEERNDPDKIYNVYRD